MGLHDGGPGPAGARDLAVPAGALALVVGGGLVLAGQPPGVVVTGVLPRAAKVHASSGLWFFLGYMLLIALSFAAAANPRLALWAGILYAVLMGLFYFSFVMVMGHMSFVRPEWLARLGEAWKRKIGDMEMIYDGRCGFWADHNQCLR